MGVFALLTVVLELGAFGEVRLWTWPRDLGLSAATGVAWVLAFGAAVLVWPRWHPVWRWPARAVVAVTGTGCAVDAILGGTCGPGVLAAPWLLAWAVWPPAAPRRSGAAFAGRRVTDAAVAVLGVFAAMVLVGRIDQRQPADAIVVFGAGVARDGSPSPTLRERTLAGCALHRAGLAPTLVFSGGHGEGALVSEPEAMRALALRHGVPASAMILDPVGVNTLATVRNVAALARRRGWRSVLMVSHDYHLLRITMFARRARLTAFTVPARGLPARKRSVWLRELAALLWYYLRPAG